MRLLNVSTLQFREFHRDTPRYIAASHRWKAGMEAMIGDIQNRSNVDKSGFQKVEGFAKYVRENFKDVEWLWIDTCCINQDSSQEVNEAVNSMFSWYANAYVCLAYLTDVFDSKEKHELDASEWFRRGWTLQELLAPQIVVFLSRDWRVIGHKASRGWTSSTFGVEVDAGPSLVSAIASITRVPESVLCDFEQSKRYTVEERLAWSAGRETTKREDVYYSLLGMFGVRMSLDYGEGTDEARRRLLGKIAKSDQQPDRAVWTATVRTQASRPIVGVEARPMVKQAWLLPRPANPQYSGYSHVLEYLKSRILSNADESCNRKQLNMVLSGMGGVGKSETILQFVDRNRTLLRERLYAALWVDCDSETAVRADLRRISRLYDWSFGDDAIFDGVKDRLGTSKTPILLILDNCDDSTVDYNRYIPNGDQVTVVLTTRLSNAKKYASPDPQDVGKKLFLRLGGLDHDAAVDLLMELSETQDRDHDSFEKGKDFYSLQEYANALDTRLAQAELLDTGSEQARYKKVSATFEVSGEALARLGSTDPSAHDALALLDILAFMHHQDVHEEIFVRAWSYEDVVLSWGEDDEEAELDIRDLSPWHVAQCRRFLHSRPLEERMHAFRKARAHLDRLSLVNVDPATKSISLHSLVYAWARARLQRPGEAWASAASILALSTEGRNDWQPFLDRLIRHLETNFKLASGPRNGAIFSPQRELCRIWHRFAWQMYRASSIETTVLCERLVERTKDCCGKSSTEVGLFDTQHILGIVYLDSGQVEEAVEQLEHVVQMRESLAEGDPDRLASQQGLARAYMYHRNEQIAQATELLEHVVKAQDKWLAVDHPDRFSSQHELARAYLTCGQTKPAIELLEHVVSVREKSLLEDHPYRLGSQHMLARAYLDDGQLGLSTELLEHVVRVREKSLLEDHPARLVSQHVLADVYWEDGQDQRALDLIQHVVAVWQTKQSELQVDRPGQIRSERFLARMLEELAVSDAAQDPVDSSSADHDPEEQA
ncbi:hypothetical protein LTR75_002527 [Friedmanniomyces endolithicus]|nr:hypothetical protein LTR38_005123 [Friedmanniomyces endolithicus]KAK0818614.1 hypothetical protein LTR75_002527 [Friedmanniomyces endolithicus]